MSLTSFNIRLCYDDANGPPYYWVVVTSTFGNNDTFINSGYGDVPGGNDPEADIYLTLNIATTNGQSQNPVVHLVELGEIQFRELFINLDGPEGGVTSGSVKVSDGEQETRPWPPH